MSIKQHWGSPEGWEPDWTDAGPWWPCMSPPPEGRPESSGWLVIFTTINIKGLLFWFEVINTPNNTSFIIFMFKTSSECADLQCFTSPRRRLASPGAALLKLGGKPMLDDSRLCISARLDPPCPLACRWRTLMASSRWSSSLLAYRKYRICNVVEGSSIWNTVGNHQLYCIPARHKLDELTHHGLDSTLKVGGRCGLARGPSPLGGRA